MSFVHLQVSSAYSLLSSTASIKSLVHTAKERGYSALALTDRNVMYGIAAFYKECVKQGIKPILGATVDVISEKNPDKGYPLVLLAKNNIGFRHLLKITSAIQTKNQQGIPVKWLTHYSDGLFAISPGREGEIEQALLNNDIEHALNAIHLYNSIFSSNHFFLSIQKHGIPEEEGLNRMIKQVADETNVKMVAANNVLYVHQDDQFAYQSLLAIKNGVKLSDMQSDGWDSNQYYLKEKDKMIELYNNELDLMENAWNISQACHAELGGTLTSLPKYPVPAEASAATYLENLCKEGLFRRYGQPTQELINRLNYELAIIIKMNFSDYFLIVWDFMKFARDNGILTGPGRGSAAGSIVAYVLYITDVDPIQYNLLFERFLNPERVTMPDIDIDFPDVKRETMIQYVKSKYGELHVAQIITFGTLAAKAALRDVGRVFGLTAKELEQLSRSIPSKLGITLQESMKESSTLQQLVASSDQYKRIFDTACKLEGLPRHTSTHAAGVVLSEQPLVDIIPIQAGHDGVYLTQYSMEYLEEFGLLKMDFLGLRNLTLLTSIMDSVNRATKQKISIHDIPMNDTSVFQLLGNGKTTGIFQLESDGMRNVLMKLKPTEFEDIVAVNALYRPGPMDNIPLYIKRKHGNEKIDYYHEDLKPILENTYGVIVYQEQIMQIASKMAGFSLGEADILRRAVSKKQKSVLDKERIHFVNGAKSRGYQEQKANEIYELIVRFADYGFNRSHAVAYSMIAYQLAYLKAKFPTYFMASLLTSAIGNEAKILQYIQELKTMNINISAPSINRSYYFFAVEKDQILYSLASIKGVGSTVLKEIIRARSKSKFEDIFDFCIRVSPKIVNRKVLEALIHSGSFDEFGVDRATLLATIDVAMQHAQLVHPDDLDQDDLFGEDDFFFKPKYVEVDDMKTEEKLALEKSVMGLYLSDHPVSAYYKYFSSLGVHSLSSIKKGSKANVVVYAGDCNVIRTKKGEQMAFLKISDQSGDMDAVVFPTIFKKVSSLLTSDEILYVEGKVEERNGKNQFNVSNVSEMSDIVQTILTNEHKLFIRICPEQDREQTKDILLSIIKKNPGNTPVIIHYEQSSKTIQLSEELFIAPTSEFMEQLTNLLGEKNVILSH